METLEGKVAVVTGAGNGIGRAMAAKLATVGMKVVLADLESGAAESAAADLRDQGFSAEGWATDVADPTSVDGLASFALKTFDEVHVVCNNAGVNRFAPFWDLSLEDWQWIMGVNFWGVVNGIRSFLPHLRERGDGHIVNTASMAALMVLAGNGAYTASKFGVLAVSDSLRLDLSHEDSAIGVTVVCPGMVATDIANAESHRRDGVAPLPDEAVKGFRQRLATKGMSPATVAELVLDAVRANRPYVFTHPDMVRPALETRTASLGQDLL
jgi:NAD(P)-dependent dehydrogenase (short-subunit alcohol dehydrogenase family)